MRFLRAGPAPSGRSAAHRGALRLARVTRFLPWVSSSTRARQPFSTPRSRAVRGEALRHRHRDAVCFRGQLGSDPSLPGAGQRFASGSSAARRCHRFTMRAFQARRTRAPWLDRATEAVGRRMSGTDRRRSSPSLLHAPSANLPSGSGGLNDELYSAVSDHGDDFQVSTERADVSTQGRD